MTLAWVDEVTVTLVTLAVAEEARLDPAWARMTEAKTCPFCSRAIRWATGVFGLKNFSQLAVIRVAADPLGAALADVAGADVAGAEVLGDELAPELLLPPQAAMPTASTPTSRGSWSIR